MGFDSLSPSHLGLRATGGVAETYRIVKDPRMSEPVLLASLELLGITGFLTPQVDPVGDKVRCDYVQGQS